MSTPPPKSTGFIMPLIALVVGLIGFILSCVAVAGCNFVNRGDTTTHCYWNYGLFSYEAVAVCSVYGNERLSCADYPSIIEDNLPGSFKAARAFGALAPAVGGLAMLISIFQIFLKFPAPLFKGIGGLYLAAFFAQPLSFLSFNIEDCNGDLADYQQIIDPEYKCKPGVNAILAIIATLFFLIAAILMLVSPVPEKAMISCSGGTPAGQPQQQMQQQPVMMMQPQQAMGGEVVTETINPDGSKTITTEVTNPDGSKTITTSVVSPNEPLPAY